MAYEELLIETEKEGIEIIEMNFMGKAKGLYADNVIAIDKKLSTADKTCVLAEELGHHHTSYGNILNYSSIKNRKQEKRARNWAYERLVGIINIITAHNAGIKNRFELAEYLNVTEEFLEEAIQYYKEKHGMYYQIDNYILYFEPNLGVLKIF